MKHAEEVMEQRKVEEKERFEQKREHARQSEAQRMDQAAVKYWIAYLDCAARRP